MSHDAIDKVPEDDLTWVERYRIEDLWKKQLDDEITSKLIKWLESDQIPTHVVLALCSPWRLSTFGCFGTRCSLFQVYYIFNV